MRDAEPGVIERSRVRDRLLSQRFTIFCSFIEFKLHEFLAGSSLLVTCTILLLQYRVHDIAQSESLRELEEPSIDSDIAKLRARPAASHRLRAAPRSTSLGYIQEGCRVLTSLRELSLISQSKHIHA